MQNKYQFATYYGQKNYPNQAAPQNNGLLGGQYEYEINGQVPKANVVKPVIQVNNAQASTNFSKLIPNSELTSYQSGKAPKRIQSLTVTGNLSAATKSLTHASPWRSSKR